MKKPGSRRTAAVVAATLGLGVIAAPLLGAAGSARAATVTPGVSKSTIRIGINVINLNSVAQFTHGLTQGDFEGAYTALIDRLNKHGGIDGRKIVPTFETINPLTSSAAAAACTQLTEDDTVFAVIGEFNGSDPECYVSAHNTPVVGGSMTDALLASAKAAWVSTSPNNDALEPAAVVAAAKAGVFKGKRVGVLAASDDAPGLDANVMAALKSNGVKPKLKATVENDAGDSEATYQQISGVLAPKFQSVGVNVLITIGDASTTWIDATGGGTYHPQLMATFYPDTSVSGANAAVVKQAVTAYTKPLAYAGKPVGWADPSLQPCIKTAKAAGVKFSNPVTTPSTSNDESYIAVAQSCGILKLFTAILARAGRNLTVDSFGHAADTLGRIEIPGLGAATYNKVNPAGTFPLYLYRWNTAKHRWDISAKPFGAT